MFEWHIEEATIWFIIRLRVDDTDLKVHLMAEEESKTVTGVGGNLALIRGTKKSKFGGLNRLHGITGILNTWRV